MFANRLILLALVAALVAGAPACDTASSSFDDACRGHDVDTCVADTTCQAVYQTDPCDAEGGCPPIFAGCITPDAPCSSFDAQLCSAMWTDVCITLWAPEGGFLECKDSACSTDADCPADANYTCQQSTVTGEKFCGF